MSWRKTFSNNFLVIGPLFFSQLTLSALSTTLTISCARLRLSTASQHFSEKLLEQASTTRNTTRSSVFEALLALKYLRILSYLRASFGKTGSLEGAAFGFGDGVSEVLQTCDGPERNLAKIARQSRIEGRSPRLCNIRLSCSCKREVASAGRTSNKVGPTPASNEYTGLIVIAEGASTANSSRVRKNVGNDAGAGISPGKGAVSMAMQTAAYFKRSAILVGQIPSHNAPGSSYRETQCLS